MSDSAPAVRDELEAAQFAPHMSTPRRLGLSPINRRRLTIFRRHKRGFWSLCVFMVIFVVSLFAEFVANDRPILAYYKGELLVPILVNYPDEKFGGFTAYADYRLKDTADEIEAHGWMLWPPIRFSYRTVNYASATPAPSPPTWALSETQCEAAGAAAAKTSGSPTRGCAAIEKDWLGTDEVDRDVLARVIYGTRASILFGLALTFLSSIVGVAAGAIQGYFGGWTDLGFQRFIEVWSSLPQLYILIIISSFIAPSILSLLAILSLFSWVNLVYVVRAEFLRARNFEYVRAARALGLNDAKIIVRHVLPNAMVATLTLLPFVMSGLGHGAHSARLPRPRSAAGLGFARRAPVGGQGSPRGTLARACRLLLDRRHPVPARLHRRGRARRLRPTQDVGMKAASMNGKRMMSPAHVVIVGGGFTGALQAVNLLRHGDARATIVERRPHPGRGLAYAAAHPDHLLNVRAGNMSAFPDDPQHFVRWLARHHPEHASGFAPRLVYGAYLSALLAEAAAGSNGRLEIVAGDVLDVTYEDGQGEGDKARVILANGRVLAADAVVLAPGNLVPYSPAGLDEADLPVDLYAQDPWTSPITANLGAGDTVLTMGTGLTMVDVALLLDAHGFQGRILALSRRGLAPRAHAGPGMAPSSRDAAPASTCAALVRTVRDRAETVGWHAAVDELRPFTQAIWRDSDIVQRRRFLRHLRPWWDVHRHRIAPQVAAKIAAMRASGRLEVAAGKLVAVLAEEAHARVTWRPRGEQATRSLAVRRIINCTGPQGDLLATDEPLLRSLLERGLIRPDPLRIGIDVDELSRAIGRNGSAQPWLLALGPITRGAFWEIVAVPDIRQQTWAVARRLSDQLASEGARLGA